MHTVTIKSIKAWEVLDSRGNPTLRVEVMLENGVSGIASVPSGASTGSNEALELRDGDTKRYDGRGVLKACRNVNDIIAKKLVGALVVDQRQIDQLMIGLDGTKNKSRLGANAILGVSLACAKAASNTLEMPLYKHIHTIYNLQSPIRSLPYPMMNILNGGRHADWCLDFQEFMIVPRQKKFSERLRCGVEIFHALRDVLKENNYTVTVGDEGGYAPKLKNDEEAFKLISEGAKRAGYQLAKEVAFAVDAAASEFYDPKKEQYELKLDKKMFNKDDLAELYQKWLVKYPLVSIEDPFDEEDWKAWTDFTKEAGGAANLMVVGDDLFTTNVERLRRGINLKAANAILIKPNQIGTLSETIDTILLAQKNKYKVIVSHRSGETGDTFISDLAVAVQADYIKTGSLCRSERVEKYNRLLEIEREVC